MRMARLDLEARVAIRTLVSRGTSYSAIARLLNVTEGAVRYQVARMRRGQVDGRSARFRQFSRQRSVLGRGCGRRNRRSARFEDPEYSDRAAEPAQSAAIGGDILALGGSNA